MRTQNQKKTAAPQQQTSLLGRSLPANSEAERAILSALLIDDQQVGSVAETLSPNDFYTPANRTVYEAILDMAQARKRIDLVTLQDELTKRGVLDQIGGVVYLITLQEDIPAVGMVEHHAKIVKEKSVLRSLIGSAASIITECYSQDDKEIESVLDHAEKTIFDISNQRTRDGFVQIDIWLKKTFQHLSDIKSHAKGITGVPSGYKKLDEMTSGFQKGDLLVAAGRPSMGKTGVSLCMAQHAALSGFSVGFFSLEMSAEQLVLRLLSSESGIPHHKIRNATISSQEWVELTNVAAGSYTVTVSDANGCESVSSFTLTEPTAVVAMIQDNGNGTATGSGSGGAFSSAALLLAILVSTAATPISRACCIA